MVDYQTLQYLKNIEFMMEKMDDKIQIIKGYYEADWIPISEVALIHGMSRQAVQKKIDNGLIDPSRETRREGKRLMVRRSAISKLKRLSANTYAA